MKAATVVQQLCKSCGTCFKFYFTCDRSLNAALDKQQLYSAATSQPSDKIPEVAFQFHCCHQGRCWREIIAPCGVWSVGSSANKWQCQCLLLPTAVARSYVTSNGRRLKDDIPHTNKERSNNKILSGSLLCSSSA